MEITEKVIPFIEKALEIRLYEKQKQYILGDGPCRFGGRASGKTTVYCIRLALSDGEPLDMRKPQEICDSTYREGNNEPRYAIWFRRYFLDIWQGLKDAGFPVRELVTENGKIKIYPY